VARISPSLFLLLLPVVGAAQAQQADEAAAGQLIEVERLTGPIPEHVAEFDAAHERYVDRMREFKADAREYVQLIESQKRRQIVDGYGRIIAGLRDDEDALRTLAKARFEDFLSKYPGAEASPHVMFRLAELYFEDAENEFLVADSNYNDRLLEFQELINALPPDATELPDPPEEAKKDYAKAVRLYDGIVGGYPRYENIDGVYYMLGYCLTEVNAKQRDVERGLEAMQAVVDDFPSSEFINDASMALGEYYFNDANDLDRAIGHYQRIVDGGEDARFYDKGLYKLAWSHYRLASAERFDEYYVAMDLFIKLLDYSERRMLAEGKQSAMKPEAIQYAAISFSDMSDLKSRDTATKVSPITVAEEFFEGVGERGYEQDIFIQLADVLTKQARYMEAIEAYEYLQTRWPNTAENPEYQFKIAQLWLSGPNRDEAASADAERVLVERYNETTDWWQANRANPDALAVARGFTEKSTANVAKDWHLEAQRTGDPAGFSRAADKYREYLLRFPFADDYYEMEWYLADALYNAKRLEECEKELLQLLKTDAHDFGDGALFRLMQTRRQILVDKYGKVEARPDNAIVERVDTSEAGAEIQVYMLTDEHKRFIEVADQITETVFTDPGYVGPRNDALPTLAYWPGQIYYEFGHYDEARRRLEGVLDDFLGVDEAEFAGSLIVATYQDEGNKQKAYEWIEKLKVLIPEAIDPELVKLGEGLFFKMAKDKADAGDFAGAAAMFLEFLELFPESEYVPDAHFNAANNLEKNGQVDQAIALFEEFIQTYKSDPRSEGMFFRIAGNYAQILELETAVRYYDDLVLNFPDSANAAAATFNAAFLRMGMGDHAAAARKLQAYATKWPEASDAETAYYLAGGEWEQVGDREALKFYQDYLRRYEGTDKQDINHNLTAQYRIIKLKEKLGQSRNLRSEWDKLEAMFVDYVQAGETIPPAGRKAAAEGAFPALWAQYEAFADIRFENDENHDVPLLLGDPETGEGGKPAELKALGAACAAFRDKYKDFTYSSATYYIQARATFDYAQAFFDIPPPRGFTPEMVIEYQAQLDPYRIKYEDAGRKMAEELLKAAIDNERWSEWQSKTIELLNQKFPRDYPAEKVEASFPSEPHISMQKGPIDIDVGAPEEPAPAPAPAPAAPAAAPPAEPTPGGE
jgi:TolA-binding protein